MGGRQHEGDLAGVLAEQRAGQDAEWAVPVIQVDRQGAVIGCRDRDGFALERKPPDADLRWGADPVARWLFPGDASYRQNFRVFAEAFAGLRSGAFGLSREIDLKNKCTKAYLKKAPRPFLVFALRRPWVF